MKFILSVSMAAIALIAASLPSQAQKAAIENSAPALPVDSPAAAIPLKTIYRVAGIYDSGGGFNEGWSTAIHCSNFNAIAEQLRYNVRDEVGGVKFNRTYTIAPMATFYVVTHHVNWLIGADVQMNIGHVGGSLTIASSSTNIICNAMIIDATFEGGSGIALHMVRYNPIAGTQE
jgi:hypothetical protein